MTARTGARLSVLAAALLFSTGGAVIKATAFTSWQVASLRSGIAAAALAVLLPTARRGWSWRTPLVAASYAATLCCYVLANKLTTAANTIFLQSTAPLYILLLGPVLLRERVRRRDLALMAAMAAGMAAFFLGRQPSFATAPDPVVGNLLGAAAGFLWALTIVGLRWLGRGRDSDAATAAAVVTGNAMAFVATLPLAVPLGPVRPADWLLIIFLGVFQIGVAYVFLTRGLRRVEAMEASLLLLLEPVLNPVWAWLVHGERPGAWALGGGAVILSATLVKTWWDSRGGGRQLPADG